MDELFLLQDRFVWTDILRNASLVALVNLQCS